MTDTGLPDRRHFVVRGATALTMDPHHGDIPDCDIEVRDGTIVSVGPGIVAPDADDIDGRRMIAMPGFVDTHWHLWGTLLRGVVGDGPTHGWFARKAKLAPHFTPDDTHTGVRLALVDALSSGFTTVHNWAHNVQSPEDADANLKAQADIGIRALFSYGAPSASPGMSLEEMAASLGEAAKLPDQVMDFDDITRVRDQWVPASDGMLSVGVNVRGPSRSTAEVYRTEWELARSLGLMIAMHCAGTRKEVARIRQIDVLNADGLLGPDMLLAHCLYISERERELCAEHGIPITVSPLSELRLAMGSPPILDHLDAGVSVSLSLDTTAISANADAFQAMRVAVGLEAIRRRDPQALTPHRAIELNTIAGAEALGLGGVTGSLTPGKRADLILIRADDPNMAPVVDPAYAVVHSAQPSNVDTVVVDGRILKGDGRLTAIDQREVVIAANESLAALCKRAGFEFPWPQRES